MQEMVRAFAALEIDRSTKERIGRYGEALRGRPDGTMWKWVRPEILHLTVRFFGNLDRKQLGKARRAIATLDGAWDAPDLALGGLGAFPSLRRPQVLWLGIEDPAGRLAALADETDRAIRMAGFGPADKPFVGHVTLARLARGRQVTELERMTSGLTPPEGNLTICSITLFQSDLRPEGPRYTPLEIARPRAGPGGTETERPADRSSMPPCARRSGQDPKDAKEGDPSNG